MHLQLMLCESVDNRIVQAMFVEFIYETKSDIVFSVKESE